MNVQTLNGSLLTTLSAVSQAGGAVDEFLRDVPLARTSLDSLTYELLDLRALLERLLGEPSVPLVLHSPILSVAAACRLVLARIDAVLADDGASSRSGQWASGVKGEIGGLYTGLQMCRRALRLAREVVNLSTSIELMADENANAVGVRVADIRHDASQILARAYRVRAQVPLPRDDRDTNRSAFGLQRGLHGLINYVESVCVEETNGDLAFGHKRDTSDYAYARPDTAQPLPSPLSMRHMTRELSRISTSESNPNSISSSESRQTSGASASWFTNDSEDPSSPGFQRNPVPRRHTNEAMDAKREPQYGSMKGLKTASVPGPSGYSLYPPPPTKPLPAIPPQRLPSRGSASADKSPASPGSRTSRGSKGSVATTSTSGRASSISSARGPVTPLHQLTFSPMPTAVEPTLPPQPPPPQQQLPQPPQTSSRSSLDVDIIPWKHIAPSDKDQGAVTYVDVSSTASVLASKHGNNVIKLWDLRSGTLVNSIKITFYVQAQTRSRDYFVRSHAILSETTSFVAIATAFGNSLEIWNWAKKKKLQTIDDANRWATVHGDIYESSWPPLATYREDRDTIGLHPVARNSKKPFGKAHIIDLRQSGLPHLPKYPELAYSATGPLLIAAAGPRPPRPGQPPPDHGSMLMAWQVDRCVDGSPASHRAYKYMTLDHHPELDNALPLCLATYGSIAVSIWIPGSYRAVPGKGRTGGWQLEAVPVKCRHVLVWDFAADATRSYEIPDAMACVSPDCRFVAYCDPASGLVVLDGATGRELWRWAAGREGVFARLGETFGKVAELAFSADGSLFFSGETDGGVGVYEVREVLRRDGR